MSDLDKTAEMLFADALATFQKAMPPVEKQATGQAGTRATKYADLAHITERAMPKLAEVGLSYLASPTLTDDGRFVLRYALLHSAGHREGGEFPLPDSANSQQIGSAISYARRYCLLALTGLAPKDDDDDGQKGSEVQTTVLPRAPRTRGATERKSAEQAAAEPDPWTTAAPAPEPERVTDQEWIEDFRRRVDKAGTVSQLRGLQGEANGQWSQHKLSREDAAALRTEVDARMKELTAPVGAT